MYENIEIKNCRIHLCVRLYWDKIDKLGDLKKCFNQLLNYNDYLMDLA